MIQPNINPEVRPDVRGLDVPTSLDSIKKTLNRLSDQPAPAKPGPKARNIIEHQTCKTIFESLNKVYKSSQHMDLDFLEKSMEVVYSKELGELDELNKDKIGVNNKNSFHFVLIKEINDVYTRHIKSPREFTKEKCNKDLQDICQRVITDHCFTNDPEKSVHEIDVQIGKVCDIIGKEKVKLSTIANKVIETEEQIVTIEKRLKKITTTKKQSAAWQTSLGTLQKKLVDFKKDEKTIIKKIDKNNITLNVLYRTKNNTILSNFDNIFTRKYADLDTIKENCKQLNKQIGEKQETLKSLRSVEKELETAKAEHRSKLKSLVNFKNGRPAEEKDRVNWLKLTSHQKINSKIFYWESRIQNLKDKQISTSDKAKFLKTYESFIHDLQAKKNEDFVEVKNCKAKIDIVKNNIVNINKKLLDVNTSLHKLDELLKNKKDPTSISRLNRKKTEYNKIAFSIQKELNKEKEELRSLEIELHEQNDLISTKRDLDEVNINNITDTLVKNLQQIDMTERSLQKDIDHFASLYTSLALRSFAPVRWFANQQSIEFRRFDKFEEIFNNKIIADRFIRVDRSNAKQNCFKEFEAGIKDIVTAKLNFNLTREEVYKRVETRLDLNSGNIKEVTEIVVNLVLQEVDDITTHYNSLARLNAEYDLGGLRGISDAPMVMPFQFQEWSKHVGNVQGRLRFEVPVYNNEKELASLVTSIQEHQHQNHTTHAMVSQIGDITGQMQVLSDQLREIDNQIQAKKDDITRYKQIQSITHQSSQGESRQQIAQFGKDIVKLERSKKQIQTQRQDIGNNILKYHICHTVSKITGKDFSQAEIAEIINQDFRFLSPDRLLMINKFINSEVARIENRHEEIDQHLERFVDRNHLFKNGFSDSPTALRVLFNELSQYSEFGVFHEDSTLLQKEGASALERPALSSKHREELNELALEAQEKALEHYDETIAILETSSLTTVSLDVDTEHAEFSRWKNPNLYSNSTLNVGLAISSQTLRGVYSLWDTYKASANKTQLKKELDQSKITRAKINLVFNKKIDKLQAAVAKFDDPHAPPLRNDYVRFLKSFDIAGIKKNGVKRDDLLRLQRFYEHYQTLGDSVFLETPDVNPQTLQAGKKLFENLTEIFSLSKDLFLLSSDIEVREAILEDNKQKFAELWKVNGAIALGSLFQAGISDAGSAASMHLHGFNPVGASNNALLLGVPIAGIVLGVGSMALGIRDTVKSVDEYRKNREEIAKLEKENVELRKTSATDLDYDTHKLLITINEATITRIKLNEGMLTKVRGAKSILSAVTGAANVTSAAIAVAGAAAFATSVGALSATGVGLAAIAGVGIIAATGLTLNDYLKSKKFQPVLEQLKKVNEAQQKYHETLQKKVTIQGLDAIHAELHSHLEKELVELDKEIEILKKEYEKFVDGEIETRLSTFWFYKDKKAAPMRKLLADVEKMNPEDSKDRRLLQSIIIKLAPDTTFTSEDDLRNKAKKLIEKQVLGNLHQGLMSQIGVFSSHSIAQES